eukprot:TRINITY_DN9007_c1_g1_i2.p2 TRINITY_DN9007_c1_g1~~TRINITY_DN9007_c1_g1_i2.p2  ORF type:complete len:208 (+),score=54.74 TRINITY_DN9007_c1_g1_i2:490-1113(+)
MLRRRVVSPKKKKQETKKKQPSPPCHVSGALVLKMDHFCPWIGQCVGHFNHRYFTLFLLYLWLSVGYAVVTIFLSWQGFLGNPSANPAVVSATESTVRLCFITCLALCVVIGGFLIWSGVLAITNQTTIEFLINRARARKARKLGLPWSNPFNLGLRKNLQQVFGPYPYWQMLMPSAAPLVCDGHHWPTADNSTGSWVAPPSAAHEV